MIKKIAILFAIATISLQAEGVSLLKVKQALSKVIINQQEILFVQNQMELKIKGLEKEIKELKKEKSLNKKIVNSDSEYKTGVLTTYQANIRLENNSDSRSLGAYSMCDNIEVTSCSFNSNSEMWCKIANRTGYIRKYLLAFKHDAKSFVTIGGDENFNGYTTMDKHKVCSVDGELIEAHNLQYKEHIFFENNGE